MTDVLIFEAYLNAAVPYIDMKWLADPINYAWNLKVKNQSNQALYFKLYNAIPNWGFGTESPGTDDVELGAVGAGSEINPLIDMVRAVPGGETYDDGNFTLKAYTDAGYTNEIASADKFVTIDIQDIENWTDVTVYVFQEDDPQGWTLSNFTVNSEKSVVPDGFSLKGSASNVDIFISRTIGIPNRNKCNMSFFMASALYLSYYGGKIRVYVDEDLVFHSPSNLPDVPNWIKFSVNLSPYKGQTKTIKIVQWAKDNRSWSWIDRIVVAGKD